MRNWSKTMRSGFLKEYVGSLGAAVHKPNEFDDLKSFCVFVGHSRSGHSLTASLLDAHRNIVMADEVRSLRYAAVPCRKEQMYWLILRNSQRISGEGRERAGYSFSVPGQWQGSFEKISVIGDKDGAVLADMAQRNFPLVRKYFDMHEVPVKVLHIYRNPFDVITTVQRRHLKYHGPQPLEKAIEFVFRRQFGIERVRRSGRASCLDIAFEEFVESPEENLQKICRFLGTSPSEKYLSDCGGAVFGNPKKTRFDVEWTAKQKEIVMAKKSKYPYLENYSFDAD